MRRIYRGIYRENAGRGQIQKCDYVAIRNLLGIDFIGVWGRGYFHVL
jgi:hypothetical protein